MRRRRPSGTRSGQTLGISLLILSLAHTPLPQPDFHNVRHHDAPGEVCEHHDHLLRWHPGAAVASDVAVLHWHWFLPGEPTADSSRDGSGPALHAHATPWDAATWDDGPRVVAPDGSSRLASRPGPCPLDLALVIPGPSRLGVVSARGVPRHLAFGATFAPGVSLTSLLHRWVC